MLSELRRPEAVRLGDGSFNGLLVGQVAGRHGSEGTPQSRDCRPVLRMRQNKLSCTGLGSGGPPLGSSPGAARYRRWWPSPGTATWLRIKYDPSCFTENSPYR